MKKNKSSQDPVVAGCRDALGVQVVQGRDQGVFRVRVEDSLLCQHTRVRVVNIDQGVEKVGRCVFEIRREDGIGVDGGGKSVPHAQVSSKLSPRPGCRTSIPYSF